MTINYSYEFIGMNTQTLSLVVKYCVDLSAALGHLVKSLS
jgi:hypothetical protein